jgi:hypothetical protein
MLNPIHLVPSDAPLYCEQCGKPLEVVQMTRKYDRYTGKPVELDVAVCQTLMSTAIGEVRRVNWLKTVYATALRQHDAWVKQSGIWVNVHDLDD